jgi:hypothetical protein
MRRIQFLLVLPPLFFSCAALSPFTLSREIPGEAASIEAVVPVWQPLEAGSPIEYFAGRVREPRLEFRALKANLEDPRLWIVVGAGAAEVSQETPGTAAGVVTSVYVRSFVESRHCVAGINANPFDPVSAKEGERRLVSGIAVSDGLVLAPPRADYDAIVFYRDGRAAITSQGELGDPGLIENAAGGFRMVLRQGTPAGTGLGEPPPRHPRSAAGLSAGGRTLYLLCVDGRRPGSLGATEAELGLLLKRLGAFDGLNFDGGGSSALALRYRDGKVRNTNIPIHGGIPGRERAVAICLGLGVR